MYKVIEILKLQFIDIQQDPNIAVPIRKEANFLMFPLLMSRYVTYQAHFKHCKK
jgi:hypothetical protein